MFGIILLVIILIGVAYAVFRYGLFNRFEMQQSRLRSCEILYLPYRGQYSKIGPLFEEVNRDCGSVFKFSETFGFYYDDPEKTEPSNCRSIVGILVNEGEEFKIKQFQSRYPGYKQTRLSTTDCLSYEMPYVNILSILLMVKTVYPKIKQYIKKEDLSESVVGGIMQIYKCVRSDKKIEVIIPLENKLQFERLYGGEGQRVRESQRLREEKLGYNDGGAEYTESESRELIRQN